MGVEPKPGAFTFRHHNRFNNNDAKNIKFDTHQLLSIQIVKPRNVLVPLVNAFDNNRGIKYIFLVKFCFIYI